MLDFIYPLNKRYDIWHATCSPNLLHVKYIFAQQVSVLVSVSHSIRWAFTFCEWSILSKSFAILKLGKCGNQWKNPLLQKLGWKFLGLFSFSQPNNRGSCWLSLFQHKTNLNFYDCWIAITLWHQNRIPMAKKSLNLLTVWMLFRMLIHSSRNAIISFKKI